MPVRHMLSTLTAYCVLSVFANVDIGVCGHCAFVCLYIPEECALTGNQVDGVQRVSNYNWIIQLTVQNLYLNATKHPGGVFFIEMRYQTPAKAYTFLIFLSFSGENVHFDTASYVFRSQSHSSMFPFFTCSYSTSTVCPRFFSSPF